MLDKVKILIADDENSIREYLRKVLERQGYHVELAVNGMEAITLVNNRDFDIVITDLKMPGMGGMQLLTRLKEKKSHLTIIVMTGYGTIETAVTAIKQGAYDFIEKPIAPKDLVSLVEKATARKEAWTKSVDIETERRNSYRFENIIGYTPQMHKVFDEIKEVAKHDISVLITGENGTGKELVANALHHRNPRNKKSHIKINCGAMTENIVESKLFGHEKGAFTGAISQQIGVFEMANKGTLFLDEIGELSPAIQVKLLRVLETAEFYRVGGSETIISDFRFVSATNKDIIEAVNNKEFREDLYYRINTVVIELPPLRDRKADIPLLSEYFLKRICKKIKKDINIISNDVMNLFMKHDWPGNVRELSNTIERCATFCKGSEIIPVNVPSRIIDKFGKEEDPGTDITKDLHDIESSHINRVLEENNWNLKRAAEALNIARGTLYSKMKKYGIKKPSLEQ